MINGPFAFLLVFALGTILGASTGASEITRASKNGRTNQPAAFLWKLGLPPCLRILAHLSRCSIGSHAGITPVVASYSPLSFCSAQLIRLVTAAVSISCVQPRFAAFA